MHDLRDLYRAIMRTPIVSTIVVLSLALGIGANAAIFSILNSLLLRSLPVREPASLVAIAGGAAGEDVQLDYPVWTTVRDRHLFDGAFAWAKDSLSEVRDGQTHPVNVIWASGRFFDTLGVGAIRGRTLAESDDRRDGGPDGPLAVISADYWQRRYGGDPGVIGTALVLDRRPFTIVGVAAPDFFGLEVGVRFDVVLPLETEPLLGRLPSRLQQWPWLHVTGRVPPHSSLAAAVTAVRGAQGEIRRLTIPDFERAEDRDAYLRAPWTLRLAASGSSRLRGSYATSLVTLFIIASLVLVVGCVNIANLQLARAAARRYDLSVRAALGASRWRMIRPVLVENIVIAAGGAALGLIVAAWTAPLLVAQLATWASAPALDLPLDARVLGATALAMTLAVLLFGTAPVLLAGRAAPIDALKRPATGQSLGAFGVRDGLVALQAAVCVVLLVGANLFIRSFVSLTGRDLGFDRRPVFVAVVDATRSTVPAAGRLALYERLRERAAATAGVQAAALSMSTPLGSAGVRVTPAVALTKTGLADDKAPRILTNLVSPDWFATYGTRMLVGRDFTTGDRAGAELVAIVNETFARRFFGPSNPVGHSLVSTEPTGDGADVLTVVGLVEDAAFTSVRAPADPQLYRPLAQAASPSLLTAMPSITVSVRAAPPMPPSRLHAPVSEALTAVDGNLSVTPIDIAQQLDAYYVRERLLKLLSGFFGALGLLLAGLGLYGVGMQTMTERRREIGIRVALGADRGRVVGLVLGRLTGLAGAGVAAGAIASLWAGKAVEGLLYGVTGRDPVALASASVILLLTCVAAGWLPARRAARTSPMIVLRDL